MARIRMGDAVRAASILVLFATAGLLPHAALGRWMMPVVVLGAAPRTYTVSELQAGLAADPAGWVGRTVLVRGITFACTPWPHLPHTPCVGWRPGIGDAGDADPSARLPIARGAPTWTVYLEGLPLVGPLLTRPWDPAWGTVRTHLARITAQAGGPCGESACDVAVLLDAAPDALGEE
jgi:hypothetical protein